ncbi:MAG: MATE family efflux transporter [Bifidobacteriaceae bacterium]|jgi:putative MATE family efflux protein|nr:MATE family efflux transporter [Bifidobacteriaceae bacterium]
MAAREEHRPRDTTQNLTEGPPTRRIIWFAVPLLLGNLFQQVYSFTDAAVVGRLLGVEALAAVGATGSLHFLLFGFSWASSAGLTIPVARAFGAGDLPLMRRFVAAGVLVSTGVAVGIAGLGTACARPLLKLLNTPAEILDQAVTFLVISFGGAAVTVAFNYLSAVIRALGDSRTPLVFLIVACLLNALLVAVFVGLFHTGVGGAAAATLVAQGVSVALCLFLVARSMPILRLGRADWHVSRAELGESARTGLSMGFQMSVIAIGAVVLQYGVNGLGVDAVAAFTAGMRVDQIAATPLTSFGVAMSTYVAQNRGAAQWRRIRIGVFRIALVVSGIAIGLGAIIIALANPLVRLFVSETEPEVLRLARQFLLVAGVLYLILAMLHLLRYSVQALGLTMAPNLSAICELVLRSVAGLVLIRQIGFLGAPLAGPLAWTGALIVIVPAWFMQRRRLIQKEAGGCQVL